MTPTSFAKVLSLNDVGQTGSNQAGILVPRSDALLLLFFPKLDARAYNPSTWITCLDAEGGSWRFRYAYYNNKLHSENGTRNEYRLTHMTTYLRHAGAEAGDILTFSSRGSRLIYDISLSKASSVGGSHGPNTVGSIKLTGWRRVH